MTTSTYETEIVADPNVPLIRITREFEAPPIERRVVGGPASWRDRRW